jgi:Bacterial Ig-like domain (group 1)
VSKVFGILIIIALNSFSVPTWAASNGVLGLTGASAGQFRVIETWPSGNVKSVKVSGILPSLSAGSTATVTLTGPGGLSVPLTVQEALYPGGPAGVARTNEPFVVGVPIADSMGISSVSGNFGGANLATDNGSTITVATGTATFTIKKANFNVLDSVVVGSTTLVSSSTGGTRGIVVTGPLPTATYPGNVTCLPQAGGSACTTLYSSAYDPNSTCTIDNSDNGPAMSVIKCRGTLFDTSGTFPYMQYTMWMTFYQNRNSVNIRLTRRNANYNTSSVPSPDSGGTFTTAAKGVKAYEIRLGTTLSATNFTIATNNATQSGSLGAGDTAFIYEGQSNGAVATGDCGFGTACANALTTDVGWTVKKNSTVLASNTTGSTCPAGWANMDDGSGNGVEIGTYQFCPSYPASLEMFGTGAEMRIGVLSAQNSGNVYEAWPLWETTDHWLNFHTSAPASPANDFNSYQAFLVARADRAYYNTTNFFAAQMPSAAEEDAFYKSAASSATPPTFSGYTLCCTTDWTPGMYREYFHWDVGGGGPYVQQDQRANNLQIFIKRGYTGRYLDATHFFRTFFSRQIPHSDGTAGSSDSTINGFLWSSRPQYGQPHQELNYASVPIIGSANSGYPPTVEYGGYDYNHMHWHGILDYYGMTGDESIRDGVLAFKEFYLDRHSYQWLAYNDTSERAHAIIMWNSAKFAEMLASTGDPDAAGVLAMGENVYEGYFRPDLCVTDGTNNWPTGCILPTPGDANPGTNPHAFDTGQSKVWGGYYAGGNLSGNGAGGAWCGIGTGWRIFQQYMQSMLIESLVAMQRANGPNWTYYKEAGDRAFGIAQYMLLQGYSDNGSSMWLDSPNDNANCHGSNCHAKFNGIANYVYLDNQQVCPAGTPSGGGYTLSDGKVYPPDVINFSMQTQFSAWRYYTRFLGTLPAPQLRTFTMALQKLADTTLLVNNFDAGGYATGEVIKGVYEPTGLSLQSVTPTISETSPGSGTYNVSWTTPPGATGTVRVKYSTTKQIVDWLGYDKFARTWTYSPATYMPWFAASITPDIAAVPGAQTMQIAAGKTGLNAGNFSVKVMAPATNAGPTPATLSMVSGNNQTGTTGILLATPFTVAVTDANGNPVSNVIVTFAVTVGGGTLSATSAATNSAGLASSTLTLGATAGVNTVVAASGTLAGSPITFNATAVAPTPASLVMGSGNNQTGTVGQALPSPFTVVVNDSKGNPVSGVTVTFTVTAGGGTLSANSVATNSTGVASTTLTLGSTPGVNTVVAASGTLAGSPITFTATGAIAAPTPTTLVMGGGNNQTGSTGQALASPFTVIVNDSKGNPVSGVTVTFTVTAGGGTLSAGSVVTNNSGVASTTLTLGSAAGANTVAAASGTLAGSPMTFTATGIVGPPAAVTWVQQQHTPGWPGFNGYHTIRYDPVSQRTIIYAVPYGSGSIYSQALFFYNASNNTFTSLSSPYGTLLTDTCPANTPTWPSDRHPYAQIAVDTNRNRMWMYGGANQTCNGATVNVTGTSVTWQCCGINVFNTLGSWTGATVAIGNKTYTVASVTDATHLQLTTGAGNQNGVSLQLTNTGGMYYLKLNPDPSTDTWQQVFPSAMPNPISITAALAYDSDDDVLFAFGSDGSSQNHDNWVYCPTDLNPTPGVLTAKQSAAGCRPDTWAEVGVAGGVRPPGVATSEMVYDPVTKKILQYGGSWGDNTARNQTWAYDVPTRTWKQKALSTTAPPVWNGTASGAYSSAPAMAYNPITHKLLYHQTSGTGAPADWQYDPAADTWTLLTQSGGGVSGPDASAAYDIANNKLITWSYLPGQADVWQGTLAASGVPRSPCDLNGDGVVNNTDVQIAISQVLTPGSCGNADLIGSGQCSVVDVQRIIYASMGGACRTGQ